MPKFYSRSDDEMSYTLDYWRDYLRKKELDSVILNEMAPEHGTGMFFCIYFEEVGESGESCGRDCEGYEPRNGKNGICKRHRPVVAPTGREFELTKDSFKEIK